MGSIVFVHDSSYKFEKYTPKGRKYIFVRYLEHSKGYVFIDEQYNKSITKIESTDITFLKKIFPNRVEIYKSTLLYETEEIDKDEFQVTYE